MNLPFVKMHGIGNDFVMIDTLAEGASSLAEAAKQHAVFLCDRRFGIGGDGVIVVMPSEDGTADFRMVMYNPDGSEAEMCGNGIRCFAKFVFDRGYTEKTLLNVMTGRGVLTTNAKTEGGKVVSVQVNMGLPILARAEIPLTIPGDSGSPAIAEDLEVDSNGYKVTLVSMGNPHCIIFVDDVDALKLSEIGPKFENHTYFPRRINTEFIQVLNRGEFKMRVWERGAGETLACGTGACAAAVACVLNDVTDRSVIGHLAGGDLKLEWAGTGGVLMTGGATEVFTGSIDLPD